MLIKNFLRERRSSREFRNKKLKFETLETIRREIDRLIRDTEGLGISFKLYQEGDKIYKGLEGIGGYTGVMIESPHYVGIEIRDDSDIAEINAGYYAEKLMTMINKLGVEACWVTVNHVDDKKRAEIFGENGKYTDYLFAIGYPTLRNPFMILADKVGKASAMEDKFVGGMGHGGLKKDIEYTSEVVSNRMKVNRFVFKDKIENEASVKDMESIGQYDTFYYVRYAPSSKNKQPWRFLIDDTNKIKLLLAYESEEDYTPIDAGIMMYYFEEIMKAVGTDTTWEFIEGEESGEKYNYRYIAEFRL